MKNIEVEGQEILIKNSYGDMAIVSKKDRTKVEEFIKNKCWNCIDNYVSGLPKMSNYAKDGTVVPDGDPPKWQVPQSTQQYTVTDKARNLQDRGQEEVSKAALKLLNSRPRKNNSQKERLKQYESFTPEERALIQSSNHANIFEPAVRAYKSDQTDKGNAQPLSEFLTNPDVAAQATMGTAERYRLFPGAENDFESYVNPLMMIGSMASGLGSVPKNIKEGNYGAAALGVAAPLAGGAMAGLGAKGVKQFANNLLNPLAGTGEIVENVAKNLKPSASNLAQKILNQNESPKLSQLIPDSDLLKKQKYYNNLNTGKDLEFTHNGIIYKKENNKYLWANPSQPNNFSEITEDFFNEGLLKHKSQAFKEITSIPSHTQSTMKFLYGLKPTNPYKKQTIFQSTHGTAPGYEQLFETNSPISISTKPLLELNDKGPLVSDRFNIRTTELEELKKKYRPDFEKLNTSLGESTYSEKDLGLFAKYQHMAEQKEKGLLDVKNNPHSSVKKFQERNPNHHDLDPTEEILLDAYTRGYDRHINGREEGVLHSKAFYENFINPKLEELIKKSKLTTDESFLRGSGDFTAKVERDGKLIEIPFSKLKDGDIFIPNSFVSTSIDSPFSGSSRIMSNYHIPKNSSYLLAEHPSNFHNGENEVLLPSKLKFKTTLNKNHYTSLDEFPEGTTLETYTKKGNQWYDGHGDLIDPVLHKSLLNYANNQPGNAAKYNFSPVNPYSLGALYLLHKAKDNKSQ